jgi:lipoate synthase
MLPPEGFAQRASTTTKNYLVISAVARHSIFDPGETRFARPIRELRLCIE